MPEPTLPARDPMRVLVHDMQGYTFVRDLAGGLARLGHEVTFVTCPSAASPHRESAKTAPGVRTVEIGLSGGFAKYDVARRLRAEREYGRLAAGVVDDVRPHVVLSSNAPLLSQHLLARAAHRSGARFVFWLQDLYGAAARQLLAERLPDRLARAAAAPFVRLERRLLVTSDHVVTIGRCLARAALDAGVTAGRHDLIPNWTDPAAVPCLDSTDTAWRRRHHPDAGRLFLYSGTLGKKHPYQCLPGLAASLPPGAHLGVVSDGLGADWLRRQARSGAAGALSVLGYQPETLLPEMLGSADVLVLLLGEEAARYSVPSKLYTYLCAGRPVLALVPPGSETAEFVREHGFGLVADPARPGEVRDAAAWLAGDAELRRQAGAAARAWAERHMDPDAMANAFESLLRGTVRHRAVA